VVAALVEQGSACPGRGSLQPPSPRSSKRSSWTDDAASAAVCTAVRFCRMQRTSEGAAPPHTHMLHGSDLPPYTSYAVLRRSVHTALSMGCVGFDDAAVADGGGARDDADGAGE
jgi:hypothetical protein